MYNKIARIGSSLRWVGMSEQVGRMNRSGLDLFGECLWVSQFWWGIAIYPQRMDIRPNMEHCIDHFRRFSWGFPYGGFLKGDPLNHGKWHPKTCVLYLVSRTLRHFASPCARKISSLGKKSWLEDTRNRYGKGRHQFFDGTKHHSGCWVLNGQKVNFRQVQNCSSNSFTSKSLTPSGKVEICLAQDPCNASSCAYTDCECFRVPNLKKHLYQLCLLDMSELEDISKLMYYTI
jgi:hypothetical protein